MQNKQGFKTSYTCSWKFGETRLSTYKFAKNIFGIPSTLKFLNVPSFRLNRTSSFPSFAIKMLEFFHKHNGLTIHGSTTKTLVHDSPTPYSFITQKYWRLRPSICIRQRFPLKTPVVKPKSAGSGTGKSLNLSFTKSKAATTHAPPLETLNVQWRASLRSYGSSNSNFMLADIDPTNNILL